MLLSRELERMIQHAKWTPAKLKGFGVRTNLILADRVEREFSADQGVEMIPLGLYMIKGDNVALVGEVDDKKDSTIDYTEIRADPISEIRH
ncbi:hypothetical protein JCM24511_00005 [Saitozyma sp. JCM 24511]|nr:hypothetical protein JCM24511_00005 [Saitozyma sp. JCM 24511]